MSEKWLIFDLETTGLWRSGLDPLDPEQPDIVQLAAAVVDSEELVVRSGMNAILYIPRESSPEALKAHGITVEMQRQFGLQPRQTLLYFLDLAALCSRVFAYNLSFDLAVMNRAIERLVYGGTTPGFGRTATALDVKSHHCVMRALTPVMMLPWPGCKAAEEAAEKYGPYKHPSLEDAYSWYVDTEGYNQHNAWADTMATLMVMRGARRMDGVDFTGPDSLLPGKDFHHEGTKDTEK